MFRLELSRSLRSKFQGDQRLPSPQSRRSKELSLKRTRVKSFVCTSTNRCQCWIIYVPLVYHDPACSKAQAVLKLFVVGLDSGGLLHVT